MNRLTFLDEQLIETTLDLEAHQTFVGFDIAGNLQDV
jgi:hypothetical protein